MQERKKVKVRRSLSAVPREQANLEAEKGETVLTNLSESGIPEFYKINGKSHANNGTPLNVPQGSFIFSKDKKMKIKDPEVLKQFGYANPKKSGYTPAEISMKFDNSKVRETLVNPMADKLSIEAAEKLIANYNEKHGLLALVQESQKGFPTGIPKVSEAYLNASGIDIEQLSKSIEGSKNDQGEVNPQGQQMAKCGGEKLKKYQDGGEPTRRRKTMAPEGSVVWDTSLADFNPNDVMVGDYVVEDGVVKKVDNLRKSNLEGSDYIDERLGKMQSTYGALANRLGSKEVREKIYDDYIDKIKKSKLSSSDKNRLISLPEEEVIDTFLKQQQQVAIIDNRHGLRDEEGKLLPDVDEWDSGTGKDKNKKYREFAAKNNMDVLSEDQIKVAQAVYKSLDSLSKKDPLFSDFRIRPTGVQDEGADKKSRISDIEGYAGNTLMGQAAGIVAPSEWDTSDLDYEEEEEEPQNLTEVAQQKETPFWLQDDVNLFGAITDRFGLKKQTPLELTGNVSIPNPTFYSPDQAIQNVLSSQKTATEGAKAFGSAADYANFANFAQGKSANQVANQIANVQNQNVGISNEFANRRAQLMNQDSAIKAASKVREWDKRNLVDAMYDNAARASDAEIRKQFNNRWTNRGMTQTLNERDDQFDVDPRTGFTYYTGVEKQLDPSKVQADVFQTAQNIMSNTPGIEPKDAFEYAMKLRGIGGSNTQSQPISYPGRKA